MDSGEEEDIIFDVNKNEQPLGEMGFFGGWGGVRGPSLGHSSGWRWWGGWGSSTVKDVRGEKRNGTWSSKRPWNVRLATVRWRALRIHGRSTIQGDICP